MVRMLRGHRGTAYVEYFLAAAAMAGATLAIWGALGSGAYGPTRDDIMDVIQGSCTVDGSDQISC